MGEHTGTHFDAPMHWVSGKDLPDNAVDTIPLKNFIAPACVLDCSAQSTADADFLLTVPFVDAWEKQYGRIEAGNWVFLRTDWSKRDVLGFGTETVGTDAGQAHLFNPPFPAHFYMHGKGRYGLQCLSNLDLLPPKGAIIVAAPLKIKQGSGSPLRVLALIASR